MGKTCTDVRHSLTSVSITGSDNSTAAQRPSGEIATPATRLTVNASSGVHRAGGACARSPDAATQAPMRSASGRDTSGRIRMSDVG